jgi:hypothetical protein
MIAEWIVPAIGLVAVLVAVVLAVWMVCILIIEIRHNIAP